MSDERGENPYPLTEEMEAAYLATKGDQDSIGVPWDCSDCYIAQILTHAYHGRRFHVTHDYYTTAEDDSPQWSLPDWVPARIACFDGIPEDRLTQDGQVLKCVWLRAWQEHNPHPLTEAMVEAYLASLEDESRIGYCSDPEECLLTEALEYAYGVPFQVHTEVYMLASEEESPQYPLPDWAKRMVTCFDRVHNDFEPVTKQEWQEAWDYWQQQHQKESAS